MYRHRYIQLIKKNNLSQQCLYENDFILFTYFFEQHCTIVEQKNTAEETGEQIRLL